MVVAAPQPNFYEFGEARWVKVTASGTLHNVAVEDLVADNAAIKNAKQQTQTEWQLLQVDSGSPGSGQIDLTGVALDQCSTGVVYRFEFYKYTGTYDPASHEAFSINGDTATPAASDLGMLLVAQNAGVNFDGVIPPAPPLPIAPAINQSIAGGIIGQDYNQSISGNAANAGDVLAYSVTGLPAGLSFDNVANAIVGTPQSVGTFPIKIIVNDVSNGLSTTADTNLVVAYAPVVFDVTFPHATQFAGYSYLFAATGNGAITYSILEALPQGLNLNGVPYGQFPIGSLITYTGVMDQANFFCVSDTVSISQGLTFPPISLPKGQAGIAYTDVPVKPTGGVAPYTIVVQNLPTGLNFTNSIIGGTPQVAGNYTVSISINDNNGQSSFQTLPLVIDAAPVVNVSATLPAGQAGIAYPATTIATSGGIGTITLSQTGLPAGLSLTGNVISGTPTASGTFSVVFTAKDSFGTTASSPVSLTIATAPDVVPPPVVNPRQAAPSQKAPLQVKPRVPSPVSTEPP